MYQVGGIADQGLKALEKVDTTALGTEDEIAFHIQRVNQIFPSMSPVSLPERTSGGGARIPYTRTLPPQGTAGSRCHSSHFSDAECLTRLDNFRPPGGWAPWSVTRQGTEDLLYPGDRPVPCEESLRSLPRSLSECNPQAIVGQDLDDPVSQS